MGILDRHLANLDRRNGVAEVERDDLGAVRVHHPECPRLRVDGQVVRRDQSLVRALDDSNFLGALGEAAEIDDL